VIVYFVTRAAEADGPIKIGVTYRLEKRIAEIARAEQADISLLASIPGGYPEEAAFHGAFRDSYIGREWFDRSAYLLEIIDQINGGQFDFATLPKQHLYKVPFRKPVDKSHLTPEFRYRQSVVTRIRQRGIAWSGPLDGIRANADPMIFFALKDEIEDYLEKAPRSGSCTLTIDTESEPGAYARLLSSPSYVRVAPDAWANVISADRPPAGGNGPGLSFAGGRANGLAPFHGSLLPHA